MRYINLFILKLFKIKNVFIPIYIVHKIGNYKLEF